MFLRHRADVTQIVSRALVVGVGSATKQEGRSTNSKAMVENGGRNKITTGFLEEPLVIKGVSPAHGADVETIHKPHSKLGGAMVPATGFGTIAGVIFVLRCANKARRKDLLLPENEEGLKAICVGLRTKSAGSKDKLIQSIEQALDADAALCAPNTPTGTIVQKVGQFQNPSKCATFFTKYTVPKLKGLCGKLRLKKTGKKAELAERIAHEICELWRVVEAAAVDPSISTAAATDARRDTPGSDVQGAISSSEASHPNEMRHALPDNAVAHLQSSGAFTMPLDEDACKIEAAQEPIEATREEQHQRDIALQHVELPPSVDDPPLQVRAAEHKEVQLAVTTEIAPDQWEDVPSSAQEGEQQQVMHGDSCAPGSAWPQGQEEEGHHRPLSEVQPTPEVYMEEEELGHDDGGGSHVVETVSLPDLEEQQDRKRQQRFMERRMKLVGYLAEEVADTMGANKDRYLADMRHVLQEASEETREAYLSDKLEEPSDALLTDRVPRVLGSLSEPPEFGAWHSEPVQEHMELIGELGPARQAWCKWWDSSTGCGEIVDLADHKPVAVVSSALTTAANVSPRLKYLRHGEFVEYRRVDRGEGQTARAVLIRGLRGWPLMCEVDGSRALSA